MPIGYLITTLLVACGVLGALAPPRRPFIVGVLSFVAGFALSELPFLAAAWLVVSTLLALDQTGLGSPAGVAAGAGAAVRPGPGAGSCPAGSCSPRSGCGARA